MTTSQPFGKWFLAVHPLLLHPTLAITWPQIVLPSDNDDLGGGSGAWHC
jgi:hypothetical protein